MEDKEQIADRIIKRLDADISDRRGLKWEWEKIDKEVMDDELKPRWKDIIIEELGYRKPGRLLNEEELNDIEAECWYDKTLTVDDKNDPVKMRLLIRDRQIQAQYDQRGGVMSEIPQFNSEDEECAFWAIHDSVDFLEGAEPVNLERVKDVSGAVPSKWQYEEDD